LLVVMGIAALTLASWFYLVRMAAMMSAAAQDQAMHAAMGMPEMAAWGWPEFVMLFTMWAVMMVAMMLPSAAPVLLLVVGTYRRRGTRAGLLTPVFGSGYLLAWGAFSVVAASLQFVLHRAAVVSAEMAIGSAVIGGTVLVAAGIYQWLPLKGACLTHCRSPLAWLSQHWREGRRGALVMGIRHGVYCVGCCWALMALLFALGVMNLFWVAAIAVLVLVEKAVPHGDRLGRVAGVALVVWGVWLVASGV
jgi:predicted metal-binding membrane protein